jgi:hypothetical protein
VLETHAVGLVSNEELEQHVDAQEKEGLIAAAELFDARDATTNLTAAQVRNLVRRTDELLERVDIGDLAIVTNDQVGYGMARMYQLLCGDKPVHVGVFREIDAARRWLNESRPRTGRESRERAGSESR